MNSPWKTTAIAMALVIATALVTGMVAANWAGRSELERRAATLKAEPLEAAVVRMAVAPQGSGLATPSRSTVEVCNRQAMQQAGAPQTVTGIVKDAAMGVVLGAGIGAAGGVVADGGTLFGLNENRKHDQTYRDAYARCMRSRGYSG
jgi:hypothetical protein